MSLGTLGRGRVIRLLCWLFQLVCATALLPRVVLYVVVPSLCHPNSLAGLYSGSLISFRLPSSGLVIPQGLERGEIQQCTSLS